MIRFSKVADWAEERRAVARQLRAARVQLAVYHGHPPTAALASTSESAAMRQRPPAAAQPLAFLAAQQSIARHFHIVEILSKALG